MSQYVSTSTPSPHLPHPLMPLARVAVVLRLSAHSVSSPSPHAEAHSGADGNLMEVRWDASCLPDLPCRPPPPHRCPLLRSPKTNDSHWCGEEKQDGECLAPEPPRRVASQQ